MRSTFVFLLVMTLVGSANAAPATQPSNKPPVTQPADEAPTSCDYIEYRHQPELGSITIQTGIVRGAKRVAGLTKRGKDLPGKGIFTFTGEKRRIFRRREKADGHKIDTLIVIDPPGEPVAKPNKGIDPNGEPETPAEPAWSAHLLVRIDGKTKIACSIGVSDDAELWIHRVTLHIEDGTIEMVALSADGQEVALSDDVLSFDDPTIITDDLFFEEDPEADSKRPVPV